MDYEQEETEVNGVTYYGPFNSKDAYSDGYAEGQDDAVLSGQLYDDDARDESAIEAAGQYCAGSSTIRCVFMDGYTDGWDNVRNNDVGE